MATLAEAQELLRIVDKALATRTADVEGLAVPLGSRRA